MTGLQSRINRLTHAFPPRGCEQCKDWNSCVLIEQHPDGSEVERSRPDVCPSCGRSVPPLAVSVMVGIPVSVA